MRRIIGLFERFRSASMYTASSVAKSLIGTAVAFVTIRWLDPKEIGLWQTLWMFQTYAFIVHLGVLTGLGRELPWVMGNKSAADVDELLANSHAVALGGSLLLLLAFPVILLVNGELSATRLVPILCIVATSALNIYETYQGACFRGSSQFDVFTKIQLADSALMVITIPMIMRWGLNGLAVRYLIQVVAEVVVRHVLMPRKVWPRLRLEPIRQLMTTGVPIFIVEYLLNFLRSIPRLVLLSTGGFIVVGLFAPASAIVSLFQLVPMSLGQYLLPVISRRIGAGAQPDSVWRLTWMSTLLYLLAGLPLVVAGWFLLPEAIRVFFPKYLDAMPAARIALLVGLVSGSSLTVNILYGIGRVSYMVTYIGVSLAAMAGLTVLFARLLPVLEGVMVGSALANLVSLVVANVLVWLACRRGFHLSVGSTGETGGPDLQDEPIVPT